MQESSGRVRVGTTSYGASGANPGLMQSHGGPSCAINQAQPCTPAEIAGMIMQGVQYGGDGMNLANLMRVSGRPEPANYFWAARYYNSGINSMTPDCHDNLSCNVQAATVSYASDIANRLQGLTDGNGARAGRQPDLFKNEAC